MIPTTQPLPVARSWYRRETLADGITMIWEPHVDVLERSNIWHVRGRDRDMLVDSGMGIVPLRASFPDLFEGRETIAVATHTHLDHVGAMHEFEHRWVHRIEAPLLERPAGIATLVSSQIPQPVRDMFVRAGYPPLGPYLIEALPAPDYDPASYRLVPAAPTRILEEGDVVDLGDRKYAVMLLPGHSPGGISLWDAASGTLFAGDVIYDGPLLYDGSGMDVGDYIRSFERLRTLPVRRVHAGHDPSFGRERMLAIIDTYLARWQSGRAS